jgi:ferredoxin
MIIAEKKPFPEIWGMVKDYKRILVAGCATCVTICWAGGEKEVEQLASRLAIAAAKEKKTIAIGKVTIERQCENEMVKELENRTGDIDIILSLGCGAGVQGISDYFPEIPVFPGLNTVFLGMPDSEGIWSERCVSCGDCFLFWTGGICPVTRCAKGLLNGPCGGTRRGGKCETDPEKDCAWVLIYNKLEKQGRLSLMEHYHMPKNYRVVKRPGKLVSHLMKENVTEG